MVKAMAEPSFDGESYDACGILQLRKAQDFSFPLRLTLTFSDTSLEEA
jgi:hypothetical protein